MSVSIARLCKSPSTAIAFEGFLVFMDAKMVFQAGNPSEYLATPTCPHFIQSSTVYVLLVGQGVFLIPNRVNCWLKLPTYFRNFLAFGWVSFPMIGFASESNLGVCAGVLALVLKRD